MAFSTGAALSTGRERDSRGCGSGIHADAGAGAIESVSFITGCIFFHAGLFLTVNPYNKSDTRHINRAIFPAKMTMENIALTANLCRAD